MAMEDQQDWCPCDIPCSAVSDRFTPDRDECSQHANYPSSIMSKIDWTEDMSSSVKSHVMHILVASGSDPTKWPEEVTSVKGSYIQTLDDLLSSARAELPKVRLSLSDACSLDEYGQLMAPGEVEDVDDPNTEFDLLIFPAQIRVKRVKKSELNKFVQHLIEWINHLNKPNVKNDTVAEPKQGTIAVEEEPTPASASASSSSSSSSSSIFPLPSESIDGTAFLICSHKLRDKRCGVSGPILVDEIDRTIAVSYPSSSLPSPIHTFKVSHIGGHKYAGNVIVYPPGIWYGRVLPCHVPHLLLAHSPNFELVDMSSGEKRILQANDETAQTELAKLKPLIRGMVDGAKTSGSKGGKAALIAM